jgi:hypothetical protein
MTEAKMSDMFKFVSDCLDLFCSRGVFTSKENYELYTKVEQLKERLIRDTPDISNDTKELFASVIKQFDYACSKGGFTTVADAHNMFVCLTLTGKLFI